VTFSDGTKVILNSASSIRFPENFHGIHREVYLEGEAYFDVAPNPDRRFIVHAQNAEVTVLGTEFNIRGWSEDEGVDVTVRSGKVSVSSSEERFKDALPAVLETGQFTRINRGAEPGAIQEIDPVVQLLWTSGGMHFNNVSLGQVITDLERRFNIDVKVSDDELLNVTYTGTFQDAELDEVMTVIAATIGGIEYSRQGRSVELH